MEKVQIKTGETKTGDIDIPDWSKELIIHPFPSRIKGLRYILKVRGGGKEDKRPIINTNAIRPIPVSGKEFICFEYVSTDMDYDVLYTFN